MREMISRIEVSSPPGVLRVMINAEAPWRSARSIADDDDFSACGRDLIVDLEFENVGSRVVCEGRRRCENSGCDYQSSKRVHARMP